MPHEEQREKNIRLVTEVALDCFLANGIEKTKVADIALRSGLTERSVFATLRPRPIWSWPRPCSTGSASSSASTGCPTPWPTAARPACRTRKTVLVCYSQLYRLDPNGMRFTLDAELTLHAAGRLHEIKNQPPEPFETSGGPMAKAIRKGLADGSISPEVDVREIYYNSYDAILGIMQRLSIGGSPSASALDYDSRMRHLSQMFVRALSGK